MFNTYEWYIPDILKPIADYKALGSSVDVETTALRDAEMQIYDNSFLVSCDEETIARMERNVGLVYTGLPSLDERRANLFILIGKATPFTWRRFKDVLERVLSSERDEYSAIKDFENYHIVLKTRTTVTPATIDFIRKFVSVVVPANITVDYMTLYNSWSSVQKYKWGQAAMFDWCTFGENYRVGDDSVIPELTNLTPNPRTSAIWSNNPPIWSDGGLVAVPVLHPISGITQARKFTLVALNYPTSRTVASLYTSDGLDFRAAPARRWGVWVLATIPGLEAYDWSKTLTTIPLPVNVWTWVEWPRIEAAGATAYLDIRTSDGSTGVIGTETFFAGGCAVPADQEWTQGYFDGSYAPPGYVSWWTGNANNSISKMSPKLI